MNQYIYIRNLLEAFIKSGVKGEENIMFIKHFSQLEMNHEEIERIVGKKDAYLLNHTYKKNDIKAPYEPFMDMIKYCYGRFYAQKLTVEEFIEQCGVYALHQPLFTSYIRKGRAERNEPILPGEVQYECKKMVQSIWNCISYIASQNEVIMVLDNFQYAGLSTISLLLNLMQKEEKQEFKLIIAYNEVEPILSFADSAFHELVNIAEDRNILFEWDGLEDIRRRDLGRTFIPDGRKIFEYLLKISNLQSMLAIYDVDYYMDLIHKRIEGSEIRIGKGEKYLFFELRGWNYILLNNPQAALLMCEKMVLLYDVDTEPEKHFRYHYLCAIAQIQLMQSNLALKSTKICCEITERLGDERKKFLAQVLALTEEFSGWNNVFAVEFEKVHIDENIIKMLEEYGFYNLLGYYYAFGGDNDAASMERLIAGEKSETMTRALEIGERLGNRNFLMTMYTKYITIFTDKGYHKYVINFYEGKLKLLEAEKDMRRMANLYLGLGYNAIISERPEKANEYINSAVELYYEQRNPECIAEALYNMAINSICVQDYISACEDLNVIFKILSNLGKATIHLCNSSKLYGLLGLCYYRIGNEYRCFMCMNRVKVLVGHLLGSQNEDDFFHWHEDLFLYYFVSGLLEKKNGNIREAYEFLQKAEYHYQSYKGSMFYTIVNFTVEYYEILCEIGETQKADDLVENAIQYCMENGYTVKSNMIAQGINKRSRQLWASRYSLTKVTKEQILKLSYHVSKESQLSERKKDINFLSAWQEMISRDDLERDVVIDNAISILRNNFNLDGALLLNQSKDGIEVLYKDKALSVDGDYKKIFDFFADSKKEFFVNRTNKFFSDYDPILSLFEKSSLETLIGIPVIRENMIIGAFIAVVNVHKKFIKNKILFNEDNLEIIKTAIIQLSICLERIQNRKRIEKINKRLNDIAVTDMLTGLYNRQGFLSMIEENEEQNVPNTILYMDLDNFKYCNDTFGHDVGDVVLEEFAHVLKRITKGHGYAVRYGGDEFVIVLENADTQKGVAVAERLYEEIKSGFCEEICKYMGRKVDIPAEKKVSTSIGIATSRDNSHTGIKMALKQADTALYSVKRTKKGRYQVYMEERAVDKRPAMDVKSMS